MIQFFKKIPVSVWVLILLVGFFISYSEIKKFGKPNSFHVVKSDAQFYHEYIAIYVFGQEPYISRDIRPVNKYTMGMAVTYLPAIGLGYIICELTGVEHNNGKSYVYQHLLYYLGLLYTIIGLIYTRYILKKWLGEYTIAITLLIIFLGTNIYYYNIFEPIMAHPAAFAFLTAFVYYSLRWIWEQQYKHALLCGLTLGLTVLIRPTNAIVVLIPGIYLMLKNPEGIHIRSFGIKQWLQIGIIGFITLLVFTPQMIYWHHYTGKWFNYSYGNERFFWDKPAILQVLFSFRKGWFIYTPIMLLIIPGAILAYAKNKTLFWSIMIYFIINLYIISSWWCWWYGGSFGMRPLIDSYGVLAVFIAYFIEYMLKQNRIILSVSILVIGFFIYLNLYQTRQARICRIHFDSMTFKAYKQVFLTENLNLTREEWDAMLSTPDYDRAQKGERFW